jgi:hypothetical protein
MLGYGDDYFSTIIEEDKCNNCGLKTPTLYPSSKYHDWWVCKDCINEKGMENEC